MAWTLSRQFSDHFSPMAPGYGFNFIVAEGFQNLARDVFAFVVVQNCIRPGIACADLSGVGLFVNENFRCSTIGFVNSLDKAFRLLARLGNYEVK
jgi:hypothetical protein